MQGLPQGMLGLRLGLKTACGDGVHGQIMAVD
jgi:hypothetical protein